MEQVPGKAVDDAEAEAVLLALGSQLQWLSYKWTGSRVVAVAKFLKDGKRRGGYGILYRPKKCYEATITYDGYTGSELCPEVFRDVATARAACERHYATGKWD